MGLLTPCFVPRRGFLYTMIVPGGGFLLPSSCVLGVCPRGRGWFWMKLIPALFPYNCLWHDNKKPLCHVEYYLFIKLCMQLDLSPCEIGSNEKL